MQCHTKQCPSLSEIKEVVGLGGTPAWTRPVYELVEPWGDGGIVGIATAFSALSLMSESAIPLSNVLRTKAVSRQKWKTQRCVFDFALKLQRDAGIAAHQGTLAACLTPENSDHARDDEQHAQRVHADSPDFQVTDIEQDYSTREAS